MKYTLAKPSSSLPLKKRNEVHIYHFPQFFVLTKEKQKIIKKKMNLCFSAQNEEKQLNLNVVIKILRLYHTRISPYLEAKLQDTATNRT